MNIRISGFPHEVDFVINELRKSNRLSIERDSKEYSSRNSSYVRRYIDVEITLDNDCPKLSGGEEATNERKT